MMKLLLSLILLCVALVPTTNAVKQQHQPAQLQPAGKPKTPSKKPKRPQLVQDALDNNKPLYYFGLGSNMLRSKVENRSSDGKIKILRMEPAVVKGHRLAFNMRAFPPFEPGMGTLEPLYDGDDASANSKALVQYENNECHGALIKLSPENYERVMKSEGVPSTASNRGYEEVVVTAYPYRNQKKPVQAIALRSRSRLSFDPCPSLRYMTILREGAKELGLKQCYQEFLKEHPVEDVPFWLRSVAKYNLIITLTLAFKFKLRFLSRFQSLLLYAVYVPSNAHVILKQISNILTFLILLPSALIGVLFYQLMQLTGTTPAFIKGMISRIVPANEETKREE